MAVALQSVSSSDFANINASATKTITKPTGLAVGDLMVAHLGFGQVGGGGVTGASYIRSGWFDLDGVAGTTTVLTDNETGLSVTYKVADSGDVAATDFAFTNNGAMILSTGGAIYRIDGQDTADPVIAYLTAAVSDDSTPSYATGITPSASCLLLMLVGGYQASATAVTSYAITTSDPGFAEQYDHRDEAATVMGGATASRPESTSTGAWSAAITGGDGTTDSVSVLLAVRPVADVTITPAVNVIVTSVIDPVVSASAGVTVSVQVIVSSVPAPTISVTDDIYSNQSKSTSTFSNQSKSTSTFSNQSKNTSTFSNQSKNTSTFSNQSKSTSTFSNQAKNPNNN